MIKFIKAYIKSMRLYYAFVTGIAGWVGVVFYDYITKTNISLVSDILISQKKIIILVFLFLSWGINQIFNDYLGLKEDRINAPNRPMVTGELNAKAALLVSTLLLIGVGIITYVYLQPIAIMPLVVGVLLNIVYEYAKGYGILGNIVFGVMIGNCTVYGYLVSGGNRQYLFSGEFIAILFMICLINSVMTYYTYFKDYEGDKKAGKKTIVVKYGITVGKWIGLGGAFLPGAAFGILYSIGAFTTQAGVAFWILALLTFFLQVWTGVLYYKYPVGDKTYYSLATNFRACACGQAALIALFDSQLGLILYLITYIFIGFLFNLHKIDKKTQGEIQSGNYSVSNL
jgi:geranylgeranylglycerol-phosphate geranylgeranyltransferase